MPEEHSIRIARQPFTFGGVARFSRAPIGRLLFTALIFGLISGAVISWFMTTCIAPVIDEAIEKLPATGAIENGVWQWPERNGRLLAANAFTSLEVRLEDANIESAPSDFAFEFGTNAVVLRSLLGLQHFSYPREYTIEINRSVLRPAWGAWRAPILFGLIPGSALVLLLSWSLLAMIYSIPVLTLGRLAARDLNFWRAWKMCMAAQLPGSLIITFGIALYSTGQISVVFVFAMFIAHFVPTIFYLFLSLFLVPRAGAGKKKGNPFNDNPDEKPRRKNPFADD